MRNTKSLCLAALLCAGTAVPALAAVQQIGSVNVDFRRDRDMKSFDLGGPVDSLRLRADRSDIDCTNVRARFGNGQTRDIFHGRLQQGRDTNIDMPGDNRTITGLTFNCGATDRSGGTIRISADVDRYHAEWMRSPDFARTWARVFNWSSNSVNNWQLVGSEHFEGRNDREQAFTGWAGRQVDSVALMPLETDARCSRVRATFGDGRGNDRNGNDRNGGFGNGGNGGFGNNRFGNDRGQNLNVNNGDVLRRGQYYKIDLPGNTRNLTSLSLQCQAVGARQVTIQIFTSH